MKWSSSARHCPPSARVMGSWLCKLLACVAALPLAAPAGWCCLAPRHQATAPAPKASHCCPCTPTPRHEQPRPPGPQPAAPAHACDCRPAATLPAGPDARTADLSLPVSLPAPSAFLSQATADVAEATDPPDTSPPPLHILHCTWLC